MKINLYAGVALCLGVLAFGQVVHAEENAGAAQRQAVTYSAEVDENEGIEVEIAGEWEDGSQISEEFSVPAISVYSMEEFEEKYGDQLSDFEMEIYQEFSAFEDYTSVTEVVMDMGDKFSFTTTYGALKNGTYANEEEYAAIRTELRSAVFRAADAYLKDSMDTYWINGVSYKATITYTRTSNMGDDSEVAARISQITIAPNYYYDGILDEIEDAAQALSDITDKIDEQTYGSRYDLILEIYNIVKELGEYNFDAMGENYNHTLTGILLEKYEHKCVCEGYSKLIKWLCDYYEIPNVLIMGGNGYNSQGDIPVDHMWNVVRMEDGKWYLVDATWDDTGEGTWYFLAGSSSLGIYGCEVREDHVGSTIFSNTEYDPFTLPVLSEKGYVRSEDDDTDVGDDNGNDAGDDTETDTKPELATVESLCAQVAGYSKIQLTWDAVEGADGYIIYRRVEDEDSFKYLYIVNKTDFLDTSASTGKYNYYRVYPYYISEQGGRVLGAASSIVYGKPALSATSNLTAAPAGKQAVRLSWSAVDGAEGYLIYGVKEGVYGYVGMTVTGLAYVDTKALDSDYNFYWVFPYVTDSNGKMIPGSCTKYVYAKGICPAVRGLKASSATGYVKLTWTKPDVYGNRDADGYLIYGKTASGTYGYIGMTTGTTSFTHRTASKTEYNFYWVFPYHYDSVGKMIVGGTPNYVYGIAK